MGYTHYTSHKKAFTKAQWAEVVADMNAIILTAIADGIQIADWAGEKQIFALEPEADEGNRVSFNGFGGDGCETFSVSPKRRPPESWENPKMRGKSFCKTGRNPYDAAVTACLCYLESAYPEHFECGSDGGVSDWEAGLALAKKALPRLDNVLRIPPGIVFEELLGRKHARCGQLLLVTLNSGGFAIVNDSALTIDYKSAGPEADAWIAAWVADLWKARQAKLPAHTEALDRWEAGKLRDMIVSAEICERLVKV